MLALSSASLSLTTPRAAPIMMGARGKAFKPYVKKVKVGPGETVADLAALEDGAGVPALGFWDPLGFTNIDLYDLGQSGAIGWLRHAEIKHGRVAMAAFVGYCVQANDIVFPWAITGGPLGDTSTMFADIAAAGSPNDQWDAVPTAGKVQILLTIAILESVGETAQPHYTKGGKPGFYPSLKDSPNIPHPIPFDLVDPFGFVNFADMDEEVKANRRKIEINNGRLAMIGIFGLISASKGLIVPGLDGLGLKPYAGETMSFFGPGDVSLPLVQQMMDGYTLFPDVFN